MSLEDILLSKGVHISENLLDCLDINFLILHMLSEPGMVKQLVSRKSQIRILFKTCHDKLNSLWAQCFLSFTKLGWALNDGFIDLILRLTVERSVSCQHDIYNAPN